MSSIIVEYGSNLVLLWVSGWLAGTVFKFFRQLFETI